MALGDGAFPNSIKLEFTQRPLLSGTPQFLLLLAMSRAGPPDAPLPGPGDFERFSGMGRGSALPGAGVYGQLANVGGTPSPGGRGVPLDLATPIFMAAGAANYLNGMQGVAPGGVSFNPFGGGMAGMNANQGSRFWSGNPRPAGAPPRPPPPPPPVAGQPIFRTPRQWLPLRRKSTPLPVSEIRPRRRYAEFKERGVLWLVLLPLQPFLYWLWRAPATGRALEASAWAGPRGWQPSDRRPPTRPCRMP